MFLNLETVSESSRSAGDNAEAWLCVHLLDEGDPQPIRPKSRAQGALDSPHHAPPQRSREGEV